MRRPFTATLLALLVTGGLAWPVQGGIVTGTLSGVSTLTPTNTPGVFVQNFTGSGTDTTYGAFEVQSQATIDFSNPPAITISGGTLTETFSQGTLFGTSSGRGTASGQGTATFMIDFVITGGTGRFVGATGEVTITGMITRTSPTTESVTGTYKGSLAFVPEPSTLAMFGPVGVVIAVWACRGRRRRAAMARTSD